MYKLLAGNRPAAAVLSLRPNLLDAADVVLSDAQEGGEGRGEGGRGHGGRGHGHGGGRGGRGGRGEGSDDDNDDDDDDECDEEEKVCVKSFLCPFLVRSLYSSATAAALLLVSTICSILLPHISTLCMYKYTYIHIVCMCCALAAANSNHLA